MLILKQAGNWSEVQEGIVKLPEVDPVAFALYEQLIYTNQLPSIHESKESNEELENLAKLYVLGERIQDLAAKNSGIDAMLAMVTDTQNGKVLCPPSARTVSIIYGGTRGAREGRQLMVDFYTYRGTSSWFDEKSPSFPPAFVYEVAKSLLEKRALPSDVMKNRESTFYHDDGIKREY